MNEYAVVVKETLERVVNVQACDLDEAIEKVVKKYEKEEIVLDFSDNVTVDFFEL